MNRWWNEDIGDLATLKKSSLERECLGKKRRNSYRSSNHQWWKLIDKPLLVFVSRMWLLNSYEANHRWFPSFCSLSLCLSFFLVFRAFHLILHWYLTFGEKEREKSSIVFLQEQVISFEQHASGFPDTFLLLMLPLGSRKSLIEHVIVSSNCSEQQTD